MNKNFLDKKREGLLAWLHREAPELVPTYKAALLMLENTDFPDRIPFIAHALREINNSLPEMLDPTSKRDKVEYETYLDKILLDWPAIPSLDPGQIDDLSEKIVRIDMHTARQIDALIQAHRKNQQQPNSLDVLFGILMRNHPSQGDLNRKIIQNFKNIHRKFTKWSKKRSLVGKVVSEEELHKQFERFENTLYSFVGNFFLSSENLDELLKKDIQPDQLDELLPQIASPHHEKYFFDNLNDHKLIPSLKEKGMFDNPFKIKNLQEGGTRYPNWPHSRYLARMAHALPDKVVAIFSTMETDNPSVIRDIVKAALSIPVEIAYKLVPTICKAAKKDLLVLCFEDAGTLAAKLAEGGDAHSAELLATALFTPRMNQLNRSSYHDHQYTEELEKVITALAPRLESSKFLIELCRWLRLFIEAGNHFDPEMGNDYSHVWRPAIEDHAENHDYHRASPMVSFVRDGFELTIENKRIDLESAFKILDMQKYIVFVRIKLHLINKFAGQIPQLARAAIMTKNFFDQAEYKHEYANLVAQRFSLLEETEKNEWFSWIEKGPNPCDPKDTDNKISAEQTASRVRYWTYGKLHLARASLGGSHKEAYEALRSEFGELMLPDLNFRFYAGVGGNTSPIKTEDLLKLDFKESVKTISEWRPANPSYAIGSEFEGLADSFQEYVSTQATAFSSQAKELINRPAIFVRTFIRSMADEIKMGNDIDIGSILDLCLWVVSRPITECTTPGQKEFGFSDKDWSWTRSEIALLMRAICQSMKENSHKYQPQEFRSRLWEIINSLCTSGMEKVDIQKQDSDPRSNDYIYTGINSLAGKSMEAVLEYARWVFNHLKQLGSTICFADLPEVQSLLESRLIDVNRTPGELAIIGSNIGLLYNIDKKWLEANANILFPLDTEGTLPKAVHWAAWNAFLTSSRPHIEFYKFFSKQFTCAATQAPLVPAPENNANPIYSLGEHLIILYMRGELPLDDKDLSLRKFLSNSTPDVRHHTIAFVGRVLERPDDISEDVATRCKKLWESYWTDAGEKDARAALGPWPLDNWLSCKKFPEEWSLEQFTKYLHVTESPDISSSAMGNFAEIANADLKKSVDILNSIVRSDREGWHIPGWLDSIYIILKAALTNDRNCGKSRQLVDYLGRLGYMKFKDLYQNLDLHHFQ